MTTAGVPEQTTLEQLREEVELLRGELDQLDARLARVDTRTETQGHALDDLETFLTQTAQLAQTTATQATTAVANGAAAAASPANDAEKATPGQGLDMRTLVPWVEANITTLISRKVPTTDGAPKWCPQWWDHAEAIARLEAARQAWITLSSAGGTGMVTYFDYLDRVVLAVLTSETGPFARCGPRYHTVERPLGHTPPPPEVHGEATPPPASPPP